MGSGTSDLNTISSSTIHQEIVREMAAVEPTYQEAMRCGAMKKASRAEMEKLMDALRTAYATYEQVYSKRAKNGDEGLVQLAIAISEHFKAYQHAKLMHVFEVGDVVQVRDEDMPALFVEGIVFDIRDPDEEEVKEGEEPVKMIHVKLNDFDEEDELDHEAWKVVSVESSDIRKVRNWDCLEVGDRVRVKEGCLHFQGVIVGFNESDQALVNFSNLFDTHHVEDPFAESDDDEPGEEDDIKPVDRRCIEKIDTKRVAVLRFRDYVRRVRNGLRVTKAFKEGGNHDEEEEQA